ncbi:MAG: ATPase [Candidatus Nealsonbacteria bacterium CG23_combo_of_CG06-09_8_20_14_all_37_18]|uniref:ATPase n=3 Tax=Candidatus Nealsoniibacteriota TaxID=1817911 RepID=A0A2G9YYW4_9BACT|nr:MAG: ATPase [Candidatus Nealsonbacteria bacterium CG23_combo_of_CG06-09_8_20_14_all_37_18]
MAEIFWHNLRIEEVAGVLKTDIKEGLSEKEVEIRQRESGPNKLPEEKPLSKLRIFLEQFRSPLIYILVIAGIITLILRDFTDAIVIFGAVFLNTIFGFFQENKTSKILAELKKVVKVKTYVIREGNEKEVEQEDLVPGDIFLLYPGNKIPADGRLIEAHNLKINEASLTGEWIPAEKKIEILLEETILADRDNMVYMGCVIEDGRGKAIVTETGIQTEIGKVAQMVRETREEKTPYQKRIIHLSKIIGILIVSLSFLIFILGIATGRDMFEMFLIAVAVAVAAIPEGLPVAITIILALGMQRILKKRGLVRKMIAAETLGSTSIICTDKTGTLTEAKMEVAGIFTEFKELISDGQKYSEAIDKNSSESHILALKIGMLCTEAFIENPEDELRQWIIRGKPMEKALLSAGIQAGFSKQELEKEQPKIDQLFFDPVYKYSASLHHFSEEENILYVLGAPEVILKMSRLSLENLARLNQKLNTLASRGSRVLGLSYKKFSNTKLKIQTDDFSEMTFVAFISLHDPIRKEVKRAIKVCRQAGMKPIIVTGDHRLTAKAIAKELGLPSKEENIIEGSELEKLSDEEFQKRLEKIEIYARVEPRQKLRIVEAWQERGQVVAMTGDGINDAPALKKADIGLALGSGTDVAKEASDLILLTDNFSIIVAAVEEGRAIIDNVRKTVTLLISQCFSEIILIGGSIIGGLPLPILPAQILWENLIEGSPQGVALAFEPKEKGIMERKPEDPKHPLLTRQMKTIIFGFGIATSFILFGLFLYLLRIGLSLPEIRTIIFAALAIDTVFYAFSCKNLRKNIWQYNPFSNLYLVFCVIFSLLMLFLAVYLPPFQSLLKTVPLNFFDWQLILGLGILNLILIEATKWYFITKSKVKD